MDDAARMVATATKAARYVARGRRSADERYELNDMIQDGCLALLQGRSAYYGVIDGLRQWLGRYGRLDIVTVNNEDLDAAYHPDPLRALIAEEALNFHHATLDRLRPKQRCAYMLQRHEGKS